MINKLKLNQNWWGKINVVSLIHEKNKKQLNIEYLTRLKEITLQ